MPKEKYLNAEQLNLDEVRNYFEGKGFRVVFLEQIWRHVHGTLQRERDTFFLKLSSTKEISNNTENEVSWNINVPQFLQSLPFVKIPKIRETGNYKGRFYYLSEFFPGDLLVSICSPDLLALRQNLDKIVHLNLLLLPLEDISLKQDLRLNKEGAANRYLNKIKERYRDVGQYDLSDLLAEVETLRHSYIPRLNHGDFVPWHLIATKDGIVLIDAEHASSYLPKYYDVCYFYERLYARMKSPGLAKEYLRMIKHNLTHEDKKEFDKELRPVLASRIITGMRDLIVLDDIDDVSDYNNLKADLLKHRLY